MKLEKKTFHKLLQV